MFYRSEIDGLRALAVIPVIFFHAGFNSFSGGFVGVDVFFVISGYLISGLIFKEIDTGNFSLLNFYERRARRLLPSLFFIMLMTLPIALLVLVPSDLINYFESLAAVSIFGSNIYFLLGMEGYFSEAAELKPLLHTWSLAVEEQYYLLFPLFIFLTWGLGKRALILTLVLIFCLSLILSYWGSHNHPSATFYLLPTRGWELLLGVFATFYLRTNPKMPSKFLQNFLGSFGLFLIAFSVVVFDKTIPFPGLHALVPTIGTLLIILFAREKNSISKFLSNKLFVGIGLISYSAYLWHVPLFAFTRNVNFQELSFSINLLLIVLTFCLAYLTWRFIENPFRRRSEFSSKAIWSISIIGSTFFIIFGVSAAKNINNIEYRMADDLMRSKQIVSADIDERLFIKNRIVLEDMNPDIIIIGSSRMMQVGKSLTNLETLNLSVSNASLQDSVAITGLASTHFNPQTIMVGLDPWLINRNSNRTQWKSLKAEYDEEINKISSGDSNLLETIDIKRNLEAESLKENGKALKPFFLLRNFGSSTSASRSFKDITKKDGTRVYNLSFQNRSTDEISKDFDAYLTHSIDNYERSPMMLQMLENLITFHSKSTEIILMLTPYHPDLYKRFLKEKPELLQIEKDFKELADLLSIRIVGSFDPRFNSCKKFEFFDGIHAKESCIKKILDS